ncbi:translation initiation factor IF-3 [Coraliomargarita sp. SDUM461003]|uniref:Translation initiation factor IF-3 n=1 Tax=Thalassobacterium maritimum TaxID=3041265 RepID=A0ABU1AWI5_9BACT|nr:translation initiation factor IF-3 [Coraliomargarita sp. SDUM461003]MBT62313.1 translation initiation factor IF-3 [Puniceicoccaceae bacterium]MDQ8208446.1 translation initiation factor IF-3 [Coraliomargarita sp. SDUM461003]HBR93087.1 translation initiation factor IF-3 [Opitutae bacterium]|tara:strand:- start:8305 stop:8973 length:669 start_codon:yes stop_codon:yes gene_type:complete
MPKYPNSRGKYQNRNRGPKGLRRNDRIRASEVRVIGPEGTNLGVMPPRKALELAKKVGLDLIEVSPSARPPVCRILDFGKFLYEESKKAKDTKQASTKLKEVKFRVSIGEHDFVTKLRRAESFLDHGNKVKLTLQFRGRENEHRELGFERVKLAAKELEGVATADSPPKLVGRQVTQILSPLPEAKRVLKFNAPDHQLDDSEDHDEDDFGPEDEEESEAAQS